MCLLLKETVYLLGPAGLHHHTGKMSAGEIALHASERPREESEPIPVRVLRHFSCSNFQFHNLTLLSDGTVKVGDDGPPHGGWREEQGGRNRLYITWHYRSDDSRANRHEYRPLQPGLWAMQAHDPRYNAFLALIQ